MQVKKCLAGAAAALCLGAAAAAPASAQNIANPVGTPFNGSNQGTWSFIVGPNLRVDCTAVVLDGTPAPATVGVRANVLGGPSTRMAAFWPTWPAGSCTMTLMGVVKPANVSARCEWAFSVDAFNPATGASRDRLGFAPPPCDTPTAFRLTDGSCAIDVPPQLLVHNGANINITGQNLPAPPAAPTAIRLDMNINQAITRTVSPGCAPVGNPNPLGSMVGRFIFGNPGIWAGP